MLKVSDAVEKIVVNDRVAIESIQRGVFNASAYAKQIQAEVEEKTIKEVVLGTIIVSLNRLITRIKKLPTFNPLVNLTNFSVTADIAEITYERTIDTDSKMAKLEAFKHELNNFFTISYGLHETTILCSESVVNSVMRHFKTEPKVELHGLVAISVRFSPDYVNVPNTIYSLVSILATKHINIVEIVSTYTELTFFVQKKEMQETIQLINTYSESLI